MEVSHFHPELLSPSTGQPFASHQNSTPVDAILPQQQAKWKHSRENSAKLVPQFSHPQNGNIVSLYKSDCSEELMNCYNSYKWVWYIIKLQETCAIMISLWPPLPNVWLSSHVHATYTNDMCRARFQYIHSFGNKSRKKLTNLLEIW